MTTATLRRGTTSVDIEIWQEGGDLAIARDVGKPNIDIKSAARQAPRSADHKSALDVITLFGVIEGPGAYSRADSLVEDLVKPHSQGDPLQLDLTAVSGWDQEYEVAVNQDAAVELDYQPGIRNVVDVALSVPIVSNTIE